MAVTLELRGLWAAAPGLSGTVELFDADFDRLDWIKILRSFWIR